MNNIANIATLTLSLAGITIATVGFTPINKQQQHQPFCPAQEFPLIPDVDNIEPYEYKHCKCGIGVYLLHENESNAKCTSCGKSQAE
jgi:hypothetical protein